MSEVIQFDKEVEFLEKMDFLIMEPCRYKILYGGRGAGKTEGIAVALIILASAKRLRIACFREFQKSIKESVHSTIKAKIYDLGLQNEFIINDVSIVSKRTGSEFIFAGLRYNIDSIKSMARIDIAWIEEANNVSATSWNKLGPTIRGRHESDPNGLGGPFGKGPEIWVSFNPELEDDETYKRFVLNPPSEFTNNISIEDAIWFKGIKDKVKNQEIELSKVEQLRFNFIRDNQYAIVVKLNHSDNKWFPPDLRAEMEELKSKNQSKYLEVWEGHTKQTLDGAIYAEEIKKVLLEGRRGKVPYDPNRPVNTFWDLGHSDKTAIWFIQTVGMEFNIINYYQDNLKKMPFYIKVLQDLGYNYGTHYLPHDGSAETLSNITPEKQLRDIGHKVRIVDRPAKKFLGINAARTVFDLCNFDEVNTSDGWQCLTHYCYKVSEETGSFSKEPDHDTPWSHGADGFQTFALSLKSETASKKKIIPKSNVVPLTGITGWMA